MFCPKCGTKNESEARYCGNCGTSLEGPDSAYIHRQERVKEDSAAFASMQTAVACEANMARPPIEVQTQYIPRPEQVAAAYADEMRRRQYADEAARLRGSLQTCRIIGVVLAVCTASSLIMSGLSGDSAMTLPSALACAVVWGAEAFFLPYGLAPILRWIGSHGFFIVFNWICILIAIMTLAVVAVIAGPIYAIWARAKMREYGSLAAC